MRIPADDYITDVMTDQVTSVNGSITSLIESLLFVADEPVTLSDLARTLDVSTSEVSDAVDNLCKTYAGRGLRIQQVNGRVQMVTAPETAPAIERFLGLALSGKLSEAAMETLAIIAYRQPVTRPEVDAIRGVNSDSVLRTLLSRGLIEEVGRLDAVGRPILYGTTFAFLQHFGLESLEDLPPLNGVAGETTVNSGREEEE
ncbi:MAG: SMC-Scp complex subunit ScpB [Anaerolineae bacterium]